MGVALCQGEEPPTDGGKTAELRALLVANGYNPSGGNSALLAVTADAHIFLGTDYPQYRTETYDNALIAEINSLNSLVTEFVLAGDLVSYHSMSPGIPPYQLHRGWAIEEYQIAKVQVERFNYRRWLIPGNHDTTAYEADADLFREHMQVPAYQKSEFGGVPVFFLNSGNAGMLDPVQHAWFATEASLISKDQEVLIVVHYPPFFSIWFQAGVKAILTEIFKSHRATVWVISGHNHSFAEQKFVHGGVTFVQTQVTCASALAQSFGDKRNPGYTLLALQDGRMVCRLFRSLKDAGFQLRPTLAQMTASPGGVSLRHDPVCDCEIRRGILRSDKPRRRISRCRRGMLYHILQEGCFPRGSVGLHGKGDPFRPGRGHRPRIFALLRHVIHPEDGTWASAVFPPAIGGGLYTVSIPEEFQSNGIFYIKLENSLMGSSEGFAMSGWALSSSAANLTEYEKWTYRTYGNLQKSQQTHPDSITPGNRLHQSDEFCIQSDTKPAKRHFGIAEDQCV